MTAAGRLGGLHRRVMANRDQIDPQHWTGMVGECRNCPGGYLFAVEDGGQKLGGVTFYSAACNRCRHEVVAPDGRVLDRSSLHSEATPGFWLHRDKRLRGESH